MRWFSRRRPEPASGTSREARFGPAPALRPTSMTPGITLESCAGAIEALSPFLPGAAAALREALGGVPVGSPVSGIAGLRTVHREAAGTLLRLGPPPGARWAFREVRAIAVVSGKVTLLDGDESREVRAGVLAFVARPSATLFVEAGKDSALAFAVAAPGFAASLA